MSARMRRTRFSAGVDAMATRNPTPLAARRGSPQGLEVPGHLFLRGAAKVQFSAWLRTRQAEWALIGAAQEGPEVLPARPMERASLGLVQVREDVPAAGSI